MLKKKSTFHSLKAHETLAIDARILEFSEFLSITVSREFQGWEFWNFLSITVFRAPPCPKNHESVDPGGGGGASIYIYIYIYVYIYIYLNPPEPTFLSGPYKFHIKVCNKNRQKK